MEVGELPKSKKMQLLRKIPRTLEKRRQGGLRKCLPSNERHKDLNLVSLTKRRKSSIVSVTKMQNMGVLLADALEKISHKFPAAAAQVAHQKPRPALEKSIWPKRIYIIQQPRKC
ncbi:death-associated protein-like 1 isoform X1 [Eretmochelys imbricata]